MCQLVGPCSLNWYICVSVAAVFHVVVLAMDLVRPKFIRLQRFQRQVRYIKDFAILENCRPPPEAHAPVDRDLWVFLGGKCLFSRDCYTPGHFLPIFLLGWFGYNTFDIGFGHSQLSNLQTISS